MIFGSHNQRNFRSHSSSSLFESRYSGKTLYKRRYLLKHFPSLSEAKGTVL